MELCILRIISKTTIQFFFVVFIPWIRMRWLYTIYAITNCGIELVLVSICCCINSLLIIILIMICIRKSFIILCICYSAWHWPSKVFFKKPPKLKVLDYTIWKTSYIVTWIKYSIYGIDSFNFIRLSYFTLK